MWYKNTTGRFFGLARKHACDWRTDGQNYDSQDRASIARTVKTYRSPPASFFYHPRYGRNTSRTCSLSCFSLDSALFLAFSLAFSDITFCLSDSSRTLIFRSSTLMADVSAEPLITSHPPTDRSTLHVSLVMVALWNRPDRYIFILFPSSFLFPRLISAVGDWMSTILRHMVWS